MGTAADGARTPSLVSVALRGAGSMFMVTASGTPAAMARTADSTRNCEKIDCCSCCPATMVEDT